MKNIKITVNGKTYNKTGFTAHDWLRLLDYIEATKGVSPISKEWTNARYTFISDTMEIPYDELLSADLGEVTKLFSEIEETIAALFLGGPAQDKTGRKQTGEHRS